MEKIRYSLLSGYSLSNISLDSVSTSRNQTELSSTNNFSAFSFSLGILVEFEKAQTGLFLGWDRISRINEEKYGWKYQGKPWLSIGFGLSIFSSENKSDKEKVIDTQK